MWWAVLNFSLLVFLFQNADCGSYNFGGCPKMRAHPNFTMTDFLGKWYLIESNENSITCASMIFKSMNSSSKYKVEQSFISGYLPFVQHIFTKTGSIKVIDKKIPASMRIRWHWSIPSENLVVFDTDYSNYAGIYLCSSMGLSSETKIYILSKTTELAETYKNKVEDSMRHNDFRDIKLTKMVHKDCPTEKSEHTLKLNVDQDLLSPKSIGAEIEKKIKENFEDKNATTEKTQETTTVQN